MWLHVSHSRNTEAQGPRCGDGSGSSHYYSNQPNGAIFALHPLNFVFSESGVLGAQRRNTSPREHRCGFLKLEDLPAGYVELCMVLNQKAERESTVPDRVTNLGEQKENGGWAGKLCLASRICWAPLRSPGSSNITVSGNLGHLTNLKPIRT